MKPSSPCCSHYEHNTLGILKRHERESRIVRVEFAAVAGFIYVRDIETHEQFHTHQTFFTHMPVIPSKYREYVFQALAPYWAKALNAYPNAIQIRPQHITNETLAIKLRYSRTAKDKYGWKHPLIDETLWASLSASLVITPLENGDVQVGPRDAKQTVTVGNLVEHRNEVKFNWSVKRDLELICELLAKRNLSPAPCFIVGSIEPDMLKDLEDRYDVGFTQRDDGMWELI